MDHALRINLIVRRLAMHLLPVGAASDGPEEAVGFARGNICSAYLRLGRMNAIAVSSREWIQADYQVRPIRENPCSAASDECLTEREAQSLTRSWIGDFCPIPLRDECATHADCSRIATERNPLFYKHVTRFAPVLSRVAKFDSCVALFPTRPLKARFDWPLLSLSRTIDQFIPIVGVINFGKREKHN